MIGLEYLILGYRELTVNTDYLTELSNLIIRSGYTADISPSGRVRLRAKAYTGLADKLDRSRITSVSEVRGLGGVILSQRRHIPSLVALLVAISLYLFSGNVVFDIRVSGNSALTEGEVTAMLADAGLSVGDIWGNIDRNSVELTLLSNFSEISWVSINRRGSVAYVEIAERISADLSQDSETPINIVADRDCVIDEITVYSGVAAVRVGDTVRKGDLLISGIIETERGTEYVHASGVVKGTTAVTVRTDTCRTRTEAVTKEQGIAYFALKILKFRVNLLNNYGNSQNGCVIIDDVKECSLLGRRLPVSFLFGKYATRHELSYELTDEELIRTSAALHDSDVAELLAGADLVRIKTEGGFEDYGYYMQSRVVFSVEVGEEKEIVTED